jgi:hypothetical protein
MSFSSRHLSAVVRMTKYHLGGADHGGEEGVLSHQAGCVGEEGCSDQRRCDEDCAILPHDRLGDLVAGGEQVVDLREVAATQRSVW